MNTLSWLVILLVTFPCFSCALEKKPLIASPQSLAVGEQLAASRQLVVISDLHIGAGRDPEKGTWYNIEDFRWPNQFVQFLKQVDSDGTGKTDLVVDGDLFELWQSVKDDCRSERTADCGCTEDEALARLYTILRTHKTTMQALGSFAKSGENRLIIIPGNHDAALLFPEVRDATLKAINGGDRVQFMAEGYWLSLDGRIYIEHGHQMGHDVNKWDSWPYPFIEQNGKRYLQRPWGEKFVQDYFDRLENQYPIVDNISSEGEGFRYLTAAEGSAGTIGDIRGFLKFYFFGVSWDQFAQSLERVERVPTKWDIDTIRTKGSQFFAESVPSDHPYASEIGNPKNARDKQSVDEMFKGLTDDDITTICNERAIQLAKQKEAGTKITITSCPKKNEELGAIAQAIFSSSDKVIGDHLEKKVCPHLNGCVERPFEVFIFGHTHLAFPPRDLSLSSGNWKPTIINSGAWQRLVTPKQIEAIRHEQAIPKEQVLPKLLPENLPPCYTYVVVKPYSKGESPKPLLRYWVGEEDKQGITKNQCSF